MPKNKDYPKWFSPYRKPTEPAHPAKPTTTKTIYDSIGISVFDGNNYSFQQLEEMAVERVGAKVSRADISIAFEDQYDYNGIGEGYSYTTGRLVIKLTDEPNPDYDRELKKYEKDLARYEKKLEEWRDRTPEWKRLKARWDAETQQEIEDKEKKELARLLKKHGKIN